MQIGKNDLLSMEFTKESIENQNNHPEWTKTTQEKGAQKVINQMEYNQSREKKVGGRAARNKRPTFNEE